MKFKELNLSANILKAVEDLGFKKMTAIQEKAIPLLLAGKDIIGQANTGTGKTAAFAIPAIERLDANSGEIQILVICPTRELTLQVAEQFEHLLKYFDCYKVLAIYGGQKISVQNKALKQKPKVIVGTPGRLLDHIREGRLKLRSTKTVILDEADKMLEMGFRDDIEEILKTTKSRELTALFSATMQAAILDLARKYQKKAQHINLVKKQEKELKIIQKYYEVDDKKKIEAIKRVIFSYRFSPVLIFANTRIQVDKISKELKKIGYSASYLHGTLPQNKREAVMRKFREGEIQVLVATDIAARGIDVDNISAVINYNLPRDSQDYIHRIGRTARAGKEGYAISVLNKRELAHLREIASEHKLSIEREKFKTIADLGATSLQILEDLLIDSVLTKKAVKSYLKILKNLKAEGLKDQVLIDRFFYELAKKKTSVFGYEL